VCTWNFSKVSSLPNVNGKILIILTFLKIYSAESSRNSQNQKNILDEFCQDFTVQNHQETLKRRALPCKRALYVQQRALQRYIHPRTFYRAESAREKRSPAMQKRRALPCTCRTLLQSRTLPCTLKSLKEPSGLLKSPALQKSPVRTTKSPTKTPTPKRPTTLYKYTHTTETQIPTPKSPTTV